MIMSCVLRSCINIAKVIQSKSHSNRTSEVALWKFETSLISRTDRSISKSMGAGASVLPASVLGRSLTKDQLNKDILTCFNFEKLGGESGQVTIQQVISALQNSTDLYFCQDWFNDVQISQLINQELLRKGFRTNFSAPKDDFVKSIDNTRLALVIITKQFIKKLNKSGSGDTSIEKLRQEFKYTTLHKTSRRMLAIVIDADMKDPKKWEGVLGATFGSSVVLDFSDERKSFESKMDELTRLISEKIGSSIEDIISNIDFNQLAQNPNYRPMDTSGASKGAIEELTQWLVENLNVATNVAQAYSAIFVAAGTGSVSKIERKLKKNPDFLGQLKGLDPKDVEQIKTKLLPSIGGKFSSSFLQKSQHKLSGQHGLLTPKSPISPIITQMKSLEELKSFLNQWSNLSEETVLATLKQAESFLFNNRTICESLGEQDKGSGLKSLVKLIKQYESNPSVVEAILPVINIVTRCGNDKTTTIIKNIELLGRFGVCDIIAEILEANQSKEVLVHLACVAIRNLTAAYVMSNQINFGYAGACETLTKLLNQYSKSSESVVQMALSAVWNLCGTDDNQHKFASSNIAEILKKLCRMHMANPKVLEPLFASIRILCYHHDDNKIRFGSIGVCENIFIAYSTHTGNPQIAMHACGAVWNLANHSANRERFSQTNISELIVMTLNTQIQVLPVVETALGAIWSLATSSPQNRMKFNECGVCDAIILTLKTHGKEIKVVELVCGALLVLVVNNPGLRIELLDSHLDTHLKPLQEVYKDHRDISHAIPVILKAIESTGH